MEALILFMTSSLLFIDIDLA